MKSRNALLGLSLLLAMPLAAQEKNYVSEVWVADQGNGKYKNPILYADYSDPDACRVGDDFYMTSSSFNCLPGLQILHSKDLVNWSIIGAAVPYALPPIETPERPEHGNRVWAPAIRHHNGEFYIFWGDPDQGAFMVKAKDPKGPWTEPVLVKPGKGIIATCPDWDEAGKVYMVHGNTGPAKVPNSIKEENITTSSIRQAACPPAGRLSSAPRTYTALTNGRRYWHRVTALSTALIREHG